MNYKLKQKHSEVLKMKNGICGNCKFGVLDPTHWDIGQMWCNEKHVFCNINNECSTVIPKYGIYKCKMFQERKSNKK